MALKRKRVTYTHELFLQGCLTIPTEGIDEANLCRQLEAVLREFGEACHMGVHDLRVLEVPLVRYQTTDADELPAPKLSRRTQFKPKGFRRE